MRGLLAASTFLALAACGQSPAADQQAAPAAAQPDAVATQAPVAAVEGWQVDAAAYPLIGTTLPPLTGEKMYGEAFSSESLRNRWTILGVWPAGNPPAEEPTYAAALASAADQDPDLDVMILYTAAEATPGNSVWPRATVNSVALAALQLPQTPAYLLIGPDLTIEGYRGALSATPQDGVKPVFRGVHEIRKQIAAPH
jgi:hypothetical protein